MLQELLQDIFHLPASQFPDSSLPTNVQIDSRQVNSESLFVALKGAKFDGHDFLPMVAKAGCRFALVDESVQEIPKTITPLYVKDTLAAIQTLAKELVRKVNPIVVGITGSIGKTTTKEFTATLLAEKYLTFFSAGNQNSQVGLAQTILNGLKPFHQIAVLEMGMSAPGHIKRLIQIAPPDIALVTKILPVHIEFFSDGLEGIAREKGSLFSHPDTKVCSHHYENSFEVKGKAVRTFCLINGPIQPPNKTPTIGLRIDDVAKGEVTFVEEGRRIACKTPQFPVEHVFENLLCAVSIARAADVSWQEIQAALPKIKLPAMRLEVHKKGSITLINDGYNAAEISMISALEYLVSLKSRCKGRGVAILGEMKELAHLSYETHARVVERAKSSADLLLTIGHGFAAFNHNWYPTTDALVQDLPKILHEHDIVLLKGSRSNGLYQLVDSPVWQLSKSQGDVS
jgi:UDP-N-acetylmuramoyl-tripeptide--D-alanyl-D-alanine ligase